MNQSDFVPVNASSTPHCDFPAPSDRTNIYSIAHIPRSLFFLAVLLGLVSCTREPSVDFAGDVEPILANYCYECHADGINKGEIALDEYASHEELSADLDLWGAIYENLDSHLMPPSDKEQPGDTDRDKVIAWIERDVFKLDPGNPDPGKPVMRRLNRTEYNRAVSDLFGLKLRPAEHFPADDTGYGFDNIGAVLTLSPSLLEKYLRASEEILDQVIPTEPKAPPEKIVGPGEFTRRKGGPDPQSGVLSSSGTLGTRFTPPGEGNYIVRVTARGSPAKNEWPLMRVEIEGIARKDFRVDSGQSKQFSITSRITDKNSGRWIDVSFLNDEYDPQAKDPKQRDRNLYLQRIDIVGPIETEPAPAAKVYQDLLSDVSIYKTDSEKAAHILRNLATRAWRRPIQQGELDKLTALYDSANNDQHSFDESVKFAISGILLSPRFLFRGETESAAGPAEPGQHVLIDEYSLASRLSFFLWSSLPDQTLLDLAGKNQLRKSLRQQVIRLLQDERSEALTENFAGQWLQLRNLDLSSPDPKQFREWNSRLRDSMRRETELFFSHVVRENRSVMDFLNADYSFLDQSLARHYGIEDRVKEGEFQKVVFTDQERNQRGGLLTHGSILTITSNPTRTSAVNRGNFVLENLIGAPAPPPPDTIEIPALEEARKEGKENLTLREQLEIHREKKLCFSCHARMDPIGFGLENFDAIGRWRDRENGEPVNASGELYTGEKFEGLVELREILSEKKSEAFVKCLSEKMLTYALGRGLEFYDKPALTEISQKTIRNDYRFHELVMAVVESVPFQKTRVIARQTEQEKAAGRN